MGSALRCDTVTSICQVVTTPLGGRQAATSERLKILLRSRPRNFSRFALHLTAAHTSLAGLPAASVMVARQGLHITGKARSASIARPRRELLVAAKAAVHNFASIDRNGEQRQR